MQASDRLSEHRPALMGHCYRMLGSVSEADDAVQETLLRAWRHLDRFEGRSSLRTWLCRIATRVCLDALAQRSRHGAFPQRLRPVDLGPHGSCEDPLEARPSESWVEPIPEALVLPESSRPEELFALRQSIRLAFVTALQRLPPRQRAALLLVEVLGCSAAEAAETLETSVPAVNSALQRARASLANQSPDPAPSPLSARESELLARYVDAFERFDVDALTGLLHEEVAFSMPPFDLWLKGPAAVRSWLFGRGAVCRGSRLVPTRASGSPAFGQYHPTEPGKPFTPWALVVLETSGDRITSWSSFLDAKHSFARFGLPPELPADASRT